MSNKFISNNSGPKQLRPGLDNAGNSSYVNASIQALFACEGFRVAVIQEGMNKTESEFCKCLCDLFINMVTGISPYFSATELRDMICLRDPYYQTDSEIDPFDFIWAICDALYESGGEEESEEEEAVRVTDSLMGEYSVAVTCEDKHESEISESFYVATLYVKRNASEPIPLQQLIDFMGDYERLYNGQCESCQRNVGLANYTFYYTGNYLILRLKPIKRKEFDRKESSVMVQHTISVMGEEYTIVACICFNTNHQSNCVYYCYAKIGNSIWYLFRDREVSIATTSVMPEQKDLTNAHILIYEKASIVSSYDKIDAQLNIKMRAQTKAQGSGRQAIKSGKGTNLRPGNQPQPQPIPPTPKPSPKEINLPEAAQAVGLQNLGNTCYMNAMLQSLYHCDDFRHQIQSGAHTGLFHELLGELFDEMESTQQTSIAPEMFVDCFVGAFPDFQRGLQHDTREFLNSLIETLFTETNTIRANPPAIEPTTSAQAWQQFLEYTNNSYLVHIFSFQNRFTSVCPMCQYSWSTFAHNYLCLLVLPSTERFDVQTCIQDSMRTAFEKEMRCRKCQYEGVNKTTLFSRLPRVLLIQMNICVPDPITFLPTKLNRNIVVNPHITVNNEIFLCCACVIHVGPNATSGHYTAYSKRGQVWYYFDDSIVTQTDPNAKLLQNSYILFYERLSAKDQPLSELLSVSQIDFSGIVVPQLK